MPDFKAIIRARLEPLDVDPARAADIVDELAQHCAQHYADLVAAGLDETAAAAQALAPIDDRGRVLARVIARADRPRATAPSPPAGGGWSVLDIWRDVRYAARLLGHAPAFAIVATITLAIGIGANATIFSLIQAVLLRPLPYAEPSRLVMVGQAEPQGRAGNVGFATIVDWRDRTRAFEEIAAIRSWYPTLVSEGEPERIPAMRVSTNFLRTLGARPAIGRDFTPQEDTPAGWRVVLLSDRLWRRRFHADPSVVGRAITMNDEAYRIVGVMPPSFVPLLSEHFYTAAEMWAALGYDRTQPFACRSCEHLKALARLKPGVSLEAAAKDLDEVFAALKREHTDYAANSKAAVTSLADELSGGVRPALLALAGAVAFVLLIACANVANLLLARVSTRQRDLALRTVLGATRARIVRQLLVESTLLALAGAAAGLALAALAVPLLTRLTPSPIPRLAAARIDWVVAGVALVMALVTAVVFGLVPALRASEPGIEMALQGGSRHTMAGPTSMVRRFLIGADVAVAVVLLAGAGLMIRSVGRLLEIDPGFDPNGVLTMDISMVGRAYRQDAAVVAYQDEMLARLRALPGVEAAALAGQVPLKGNIDRWGVHVEGRPQSADDPFAERYSVTPDYFAAMRIPVRRGRLIGEADRATSERVVVIGDQMARALWPGADAIGTRIKIGGFDGPWYTIVGVVGDVRHVALDAPPTFQMYTSQAQLTDSFLTVVIRSRGDLALLAPGARQAIWAVARDVPVYASMPLTTLVEQSVGPRRFVQILLELFAMVALLMTVVGIYGVVSYSVTERTREIGIRAAFGATRGDIMRLVLGSGLATVAAGLGIGIALAAAITRYLQDLLYGVSALDPVTFTVVLIVLFAVGAVAHAVPAARAIRVDPAVALRQE